MKIWKKKNSKITMVLVILFLFSILLFRADKKSVDMGLKPITPIGEITVITPVKFSFIADRDNLSGVELQFATYAREDLTGVIEVKVNIAEENTFTDIIDVSILKDNRFYLIDFPVAKNSYGKEVEIQLSTSDLHSGNTVTLWTEDVVREGTRTIFGGKELENTIVYKEQIEDGLNKVSTTLLIILVLNIFLMIIYKADDKRASRWLKLTTSKEWRGVIYIIFGVLLITKMGFYSNYVANFPDESTHVAYIAYLEETGKIIPEFENMHNLKSDLSDDSVVAIRQMSENDINYLGHSPLYYLILKVTDNVRFFPNGDISINLLFLRWITQGMGVLGVIIYFYLGYKNIKSVALTVCYAATTTLVPMFAYGLSGITNDTLALIGVAILFCGMCEFEKGENGYRVYLLIGIGVFLSGLSKLTCGMIIGVAGICYILYLLKGGQIRRIFCREFVVTIPFYALVIGYYAYILKKYGVLQPGLSVVAPEYMKQTGWYVALEDRITLDFFEFSKIYWTGFFDTWISIRSVISLSKFGQVWKLSGIGTFSILLFSFIGAVVAFVKEKEGQMKIASMFMVGVEVTAIIQFYKSYTEDYLINGRIGAYQSRYYLCCIGIMAFLVCYVFNLMAKKVRNGMEINSKRDQLIIEICGIIVSLFYAFLLLYDDIIYFLMNFTEYL